MKTYTLTFLINFLLLLITLVRCQPTDNRLHRPQRRNDPDGSVICENGEEKKDFLLRPYYIHAQRLIDNKITPNKKKTIGYNPLEGMPDAVKKMGGVGKECKTVYEDVYTPAKVDSVAVKLCSDDLKRAVEWSASEIKGVVEKIMKECTENKYSMKKSAGRVVYPSKGGYVQLTIADEIRKNIELQPENEAEGQKKPME